MLRMHLISYKVIFLKMNKKLKFWSTMLKVKNKEQKELVLICIKLIIKIYLLDLSMKMLLNNK